MNRKSSTLDLRSLMSGPDGLGSVAGRRMRPALVGKIGKSGSSEVWRVSLSGVRQVDVTFARETIIAMIQQHLGRHGVCLADPTSEDVLENIAAAAERAKVPVVIWRGGTPRLVGPPPARGLASAFAAAMTRPQLRAAELAQALDISLTNASTKLKQLWTGGYLMRDEVTSATGGNEFIYARIG